MLRKILAAIVGYVVMVAVVLAGIAVGWLILGDRGPPVSLSGSA